MQNAKKDQRKVLRQGNSLAMTISTAAAEQLRIREGDKIVSYVEGDKLITMRVK